MALRTRPDEIPIRIPTACTKTLNTQARKAFPECGVEDLLDNQPSQE